VHRFSEIAENMHNIFIWKNDKKDIEAERVDNMTQSKKQQERQWNVRKQSQNEHGKVKSFKELDNKSK